MSQPPFQRPPLREVLAAWRQCLTRHELPPEPLWIFSENLCVERLTATPGNFHYGFQTRFTPPDDDAFEIAYDQFCDTGARLVFYRLGSCARGSVCILLCDPWFESKTARDGYERHDQWGISFRPGQTGTVEEITELTRWVRRVKRDRAFHDLDFAMSLETIGEIKVHGRALMPYERFAQTMLNRLRRMLGQ